MDLFTTFNIDNALYFTVQLVIAISALGLFVFSFLVTCFFLYFSEHSYAQTFWVLLRPLAIGFMFFYFSRSIYLGKLLERLQGTRWEGFAHSCQVALKELHGQEKNIP